ncbi:MAG: M15 family metallopeptidase [Pyrinomonadaceae bacterium]|nr:M15 family metallopeptidase [Pyrinomonadaceae bacterium]
MKLLILFVIAVFAVICPAQEEITKDYLMGKFQPWKDKRFTISGGNYLRKETLEAYQKMQAEARNSGVYLQIVSATRTFIEQKRLWENKWTARTPVNTDTGEFLPKPNTLKDTLTKEQRALRILEFTAMPSASRHHWGTDLDFNDVNPSYWSSMRGQKEYFWLVENAPKFGFCQVYSANRQTGYHEEKWHWSYLPIARNLTNEYQKQIIDSDITLTEFIGSETAITTRFIENYVLGINSDCK